MNDYEPIPYAGDEASVIGALLATPDALPAVRPVLQPDDFADLGLRGAYTAMLTLEVRTGGMNLVLVRDELERVGLLEAAGGYAGLVTLAACVPDPWHVAAYARLVAGDATLRRMRGALEQAGTLSGTVDDAALPDAITQAQDVLRAALAGRDAGTVRPLDELLHAALETFDAAATGAGTVGLPSGLRDLDRLSGGLRRGDLTILAARPAMGKSALALCILRRALLDGKAALLFSLEMDGEQVSERLICMEASIDLAAARGAHLDVDDYAALVAAASRLSGGDVYVDEAAVVRTDEIAARARDLRRDLGRLDLVIVDYLQLVDGSEKNNNRVQEVDKVARDLKALARDLDVPVLALAQLSRGVDGRPGHRPLLSDLREAGGIEANADNVLFLVRQHVYTPDGADEHDAEIIMAKQRNGPTGAAHLRWEPRFTRFDNAAHGWQGR